MPVTIQDLAQQLNLSKGTVSRVLNRRNDSLISEATRLRVIETARELGYHPNRAARSLATGRSGAIAFYTHELTAISSAVINRMQPLVRGQDLDMIVHTFDRGSDQQVEHVVSAWQADGVIAYEPHEYIHLMFDSRAGARPPMVTMGTYLIVDTDFVGCDLVPELHHAVQHMMEIGCRRVVYVEDAADRPIPDFRHQAYKAAMQDAGLPPEFLLIPGGSRETARRMIREFVGSQGVPDGILCRYDDLAIGVYRGLRDMNLRIPEDVALVGCDGIEETEYMDPTLTTIVQPIAKMCDLAWEILEKRMRVPDRALEQVILPSRLEKRGSTQR